ncbi:MAG: 50S ribosomal protein L22 [Candidatus Sumerlaeia bacterium]
MSRNKPQRDRIQATRDSFVSLGTARYLRVTPRKVRLVADLIRGKRVGEARRILEFTNRPSAAPHVKKLLDSVVAGADRVYQGDVDELVVARVVVDGGPVLKRIQPRAMGRAFRILKRTSHITIGLKEQGA